MSKFLLNLISRFSFLPKGLALKEDPIFSTFFEIFSILIGNVNIFDDFPECFPGPRQVYRFWISAYSESVSFLLFVQLYVCASVCPDAQTLFYRFICLLPNSLLLFLKYNTFSSPCHYVHKIFQQNLLHHRRHLPSIPYCVLSTSSAHFHCVSFSSQCHIKISHPKIPDYSTTFSTCTSTFVPVNSWRTPRKFITPFIFHVSLAIWCVSHRKFCW